MSKDSSWRRGTGFYSCNKHLVEIFCKGIAFRNKRLNCIISVLDTQIRYQCQCLTLCLALFLLGRVGLYWGCTLSVDTVLSTFVYCWKPVIDGGFSGFRNQPGDELKGLFTCFHLGYEKTASWE